jgi:hypothetical protein
MLQAVDEGLCVGAWFGHPEQAAIKVINPPSSLVGGVLVNKNIGRSPVIAALGSSAPELLTRQRPLVARSGLTAGDRVEGGSGGTQDGTCVEPPANGLQAFVGERRASLAKA